jgi:uncharacterized protein YdhG (YjbR/CyaY superfamily)
MKEHTQKTIQGYIQTFPKETQALLHSLYLTIKKVAPSASETIKYGIPTFVEHGNLIHFGGYPKHIGLYPAPSAISHFKKELSSYKQGKGSVQFPLDEPLPLSLITKIVLFRLEENKKKRSETK